MSIKKISDNVISEMARSRDFQNRTQEIVSAADHDFRKETVESEEYMRAYKKLMKEFYQEFM